MYKNVPVVNGFAKCVVIGCRNPLVSSDAMRQRMDGRKMVSIPKLHSKVKDGDIEGDWVTIGVIVDKLPPRQVHTCTRVQ